MNTQLKKNLVMLLMSGLIVITLARLGQIANAQTGDGIKIYLPVLCSACNNSSNTPTATVMRTLTPAVTVTSTPTSSGFTLSSSAVVNGGTLPVEYTCDGTSATLPLNWSGAPANTKSFALTMYHIPGPGDSHWYWVLYNIPVTVTNLPKNVTGIGTLGNNSVNGRTEYAPPCSQGPGVKVYSYTLYALSAAPVFTVAALAVSRDILLAAISDRTLASAELGVNYTRPFTGTATPSASVTTTPTPASTAKMNISQTLSDEAQKNTIAFDALAFMTGDMCSDTFLPPGKVADFSGFQFLRDNDPTNMGHNTDFVTIIAGNILNIFDSSQTQQFVASAKVEADLINNYGYGHFPLIKAFRRQIASDFPTGSTGLDKAAVLAYSADLYKIDGQISYNRAKLFGTILRSLTTEQKAKLDALTKLNGVGKWITSTLNLTDTLKGLTPDEGVSVMTYASEMYSWYAGSVEADTYFCPERQGTYFGSFYMKDMPAMGNPNFTIPDNLTADMGSQFLASLTLTQAQLITNLVNIQRSSLEGIVATREDISTQLRQLMTAETIDQAAVLALAEQYGQEDGEIIYNYAVNFSAVYNSLTTAQKTQLMKLRTDWNRISCSGVYIYSAPLTSMPTITNTDFLFGK
jgi:phosphatidylethanolamine-binding protein (PEBP) family uncharacterized protein/Spy/CpxP family protein refolding chaperone